MLNECNYNFRKFWKWIWPWRSVYRSIIAFLFECAKGHKKTRRLDTGFLRFYAVIIAAISVFEELDVFCQHVGIREGLNIFVIRFKCEYGRIDAFDFPDVIDNFVSAFVYFNKHVYAFKQFYSFFCFAQIFSYFSHIWIITELKEFKLAQSAAKHGILNGVKTIVKAVEKKDINFLMK